MKKGHFVWDDFSDQPHVIKDKNFKKAMRQKYWLDYVKMFCINALFYPLSVLATPFFRSKSVDTSKFFGMSVNLDKGLDQVELIHELGCKNILIRLPLSDVANLKAYVEFAKHFYECEITINILQDRAHIEHKMMLQESLTNIFIAFNGIAQNFQIGNAINRLKWGFASVQEYLEFYEVAYQIKRNSFKEYNLLGPCVIDFEYYYTIAALFNSSKLYFDKVSALLYVDRRGAPENKQGSYDTTKKIDLLYSMASLSKHSSNKLVITEANWPLSDTKPYAPTSEKECVSTDEYARYMLRYYLLALGTRKVETIFWHQLIAPGYGLVDNRRGLILRRQAFEVFRTMVHFLQDSTQVQFSHSGNKYQVACQHQGRRLEIMWTNSAKTIDLPMMYEAYDMYGDRILNTIQISENPIYVYRR